MNTNQNTPHNGGKTGFFGRFMSRIDKVAPETLPQFLSRLAEDWRTLEMVFESLQEGVLMLEPGGAVAFANPAASRLLGGNFSGFAPAVPPRGTLGKRTLQWEFEVTYPERRAISAYALTIRRGRLLVILRDVTAERQREEAERDDERLNAVKMLASGVAHEIGNPLNALNIHLQLLEREIGDVALPKRRKDELTEYVQIARSEVARLDGIITQFLRALRPAKPRLEPGDAADILRKTLEVMRVEIGNRKIEVAITSAAEIPKVLIDPDQMKQVFFNLIKNALEAMPDGGKIEVSFSATDENLRIDFSDNGPGIPADQIGRIFEAYHTTKPGGSGLGLMIVRRIIREHGGSIEVASKEGEGARISLILPRAQKRIRRLKE